MHLLQAINRHLDRTRISATRFGREALGDPRFVHDLRKGREPLPRTIARVQSYIASASAA